jgi:hypothetical protein
MGTLGWFFTGNKWQECASDWRKPTLNREEKVLIVSGGASAGGGRGEKGFRHEQLSSEQGAARRKKRCKNVKEPNKFEGRNLVFCIIRRSKLTRGGRGWRERRRKKGKINLSPRPTHWHRPSESLSYSSDG